MGMAGERFSLKERLLLATVLALGRCKIYKKSASSLDE
jgi:hypothetical protein